MRAATRLWTGGVAALLLGVAAAAAAALVFVVVGPRRDASTSAPLPLPLPAKMSHREAERRFGLSLPESESVVPDAALATPRQLAGALWYCRAELAAFAAPPSAPTPRQGEDAAPTTKATAVAATTAGTTCLTTPRRLSPANETHVSVSVCIQDADETSGWFLVQRVRGCFESESKQTTPDFTTDATWRRLVDATFASEDFALTLEGPEIHGLERTHVGPCTFELPFRVTAPGRYRVSLMWTRSGYRAVAEDQKEWPAPETAFPLGHGVFVELGRGLSTSERQGGDQENLSTCTTPEQVQHGRWVLPSPRHVRFVDEPLHKRNGVRRFVDAEEYEWRPFSCRLPSLSELLLGGECVRGGGSLTLMGDSHGRLAFIALVNALCGKTVFRDQDVPLFGWSPVLNMSVCGDGAPGVAATTTTRLAYVPTHTGSAIGGVLDSLLEDAATRNPHRRSVAVVNFGQHMCSVPWRFERFRGVVQRTLLGKLARMPLSVRTKQVAWFTMPAFPHRSDGFVRTSKDGRTLARVSLLNAWVVEQLAGLGVPVSPLGRMTLPLTAAFHDLAHFPPNVYEAMLRVALVGVCPVK